MKKEDQVCTVYYLSLKKGGLSGSIRIRGVTQPFWRPRRADHLRPGVQDKPGHPSLLKIQNFGMRAHSYNPRYLGG